MTQTSPSGELDILDTAGYGSVTLTQAISIRNAQGSTASISVQPGQTGVTINAAATDTIVLQGLTIEGGNVGFNGIVANSFGNLTIADCVIQNLVSSGTVTPSGTGISLIPAAGSIRVAVLNTTLTNNGTAGLAYNPANSAASATIEINNVLATANGAGFVFGTVQRSNVIRANFVNSTAVGNIGNGFDFAGSGTTATIDQSRATGNGQSGIFSRNTIGLTVFLGRSVVSGNATGVTGAGTVKSYKDNRIDGNTVDLPQGLDTALTK